MDKKKGVTILIIIAIILAIIAISLNMIRGDVETTRGSQEVQPTSGEVGIEIVPGDIEDKSTSINQELNP